MNTPTVAWWAWLALGVLLLGVEALTPGGFFVVFFGAGAVLVGVLAAAGIAEPLWLQVLLFAVSSIGSLVLFRERLLVLVRRTAPRAVDSFVDEEALAMAAMAPAAPGKVELRGSAWNARNAGDEPIDAGDRCRVIRVEGLVVFVRRSS